MKFKYLILTLLLAGFLLIYLLFPEKNKIEKTGSELVGEYDIILVIGQSNTHQGIGLDRKLDKPSNNIKQLGRFGWNDYKIIPATEPLEHISSLPGCIGFALTFAKEYEKEFLEKGRKVLIIPAGMGSTGFLNNYWNPGDTLYQDAVARTNFVLDNCNSKLVAILWHQGENDIENPDFQKRLDTMIVKMRKDLRGENNKVPFILGGLVPYWTSQDNSRIRLNTIIANTVRRVEYTGFADPTKPEVIVKPDNDFVSIHFDAAGQREMGRRYFSEYCTKSSHR